MRLLNYWLGVMNRLQMFGHGTKRVVVEVGGVEHTIGSVWVDGDRVVIMAEKE